MAIAKSSLSIAVQGFADFLASKFTQDVTVTVDSPQAAHEQVKGADKALLNIFCYRLTPSGIHPDATSGEALFVRANVLLTAFSNSTDASLKDTDLRVLGHALSVLQSNPVIPVILPATPGSAEAGNLPPRTTYYQMQAALQAPEMEEMNHIWSIQGGDLAYRLSAAFELALIPIEPLEHAEPAPDVGSVILDIDAAMPLVTVDAEPGLGPSPIGIPPAGATTTWLPFSMLSVGDELTAAGTVSAGTSSVNISIAGEVGETADVVVSWTRADGTQDVQAAQVADVSVARLTAEAPTKAITLTNAALGDVAVISVRASGDDKAPFGNTLTVEVAA